MNFLPLLVAMIERSCMAGFTQYTALLDTNVLVPSTLADILIRFHLKNLYRAKWSQKIILELEKTLKHIRPDTNISKRIQLMQLAVIDAEVTGFELLETRINLKPDHNDKHVLAAAIIGHCDTIVTFNTNDFKEKYLKPFSVTACHPDDFVMDQITLDTPRAMTTISINVTQPNFAFPPTSQIPHWNGSDLTR